MPDLYYSSVVLYNKIQAEIISALYFINDGVKITFYRRRRIGKSIDKRGKLDPFA